MKCGSLMSSSTNSGWDASSWATSLPAPSSPVDRETAPFLSSGSAELACDDFLIALSFYYLADVNPGDTAALIFWHPLNLAQRYVCRAKDAISIVALILGQLIFLVRASRTGPLALRARPRDDRATGHPRVARASRSDVDRRTPTSNRSSLVTSAHFGIFSSVASFLKGDLASGAVHDDLFSRGDALCGIRYADDRRDAVLSGHDRAVRHGSAHLHHQAAGGKEERRPPRIGRRRHQNFAWLQVGVVRIEDHACPRAHRARRCRGSAQRAVAGRVECLQGGRLGAVG